MISIKILLNPNECDEAFKNRMPPTITYVISGLTVQDEEINIKSICDWYHDEPDTEVFIQYLKNIYLCDIDLIF